MSYNVTGRYYMGVDYSKGSDYGVIREIARDSLPDNDDRDYYTEWATEFGAERSDIKALAMPFFYDTVVDRTMEQIKELVKQNLASRGHQFPKKES